MATLGTSPVQAHLIAQKIARYRKDFRAFATEQLKVSGRPLNFWPCQIPLVESIEKQFKEQGFVRSVWLKARQVGASTLSEAFVSWRTMLWPYTNAIVIADEAPRAGILYDISRSFYDNLDDDIKPLGRYHTKRELVFANPSAATRKNDPGLRSKIVIESAHKKNIAIGSNWSIAHLSECARFPDPHFVMDGIIPAVHRIPGTMIIMESSAEMAGQWFREFCEASERGETSFNFQFVPWYLQPEYYECPICRRVFPNMCLSEDHQIRGLQKLELSAEERHLVAEFGLKAGHIFWLRNKLGEMGNDWDLFRQNYPLTPDDAWVTPGAQVFPTNHLQPLRALVTPPKRRAEIHPGARILDHPQGRLWIWEEPKQGKAYDIGVDVAQGAGRDDDDYNEFLDYSVACVLERGTNKQVAEWASRALDPFEFAKTLYSLGTYYNTAQLAVETNGIGAGTNQQLSKMGYINVYVWRYRDEAVPRYSKKTGWETNPRSKPWLVGFALHEMMNKRIHVASEILFKEMSAFVRKSDREWGAVAGMHDDRVMAWMIALLTSDDENFERYYGLQKETEDQYRKDDPDAESKKRQPEDWECDRGFRGSGKTKDPDWKPWSYEDTDFRG